MSTTIIRPFFKEFTKNSRLSLQKVPWLTHLRTRKERRRKNVGQSTRVQGSANDQDHWIKRSLDFFNFDQIFFSWIRISDIFFDLYFLLWIISPLVVIYISCSGSYHTSGDPNLFDLDHDHLVVIQIFLILIILNLMIWSFWSKSNDQWSFAPTPARVEK